MLGHQKSCVCILYRSCAGISWTFYFYRRRILNRPVVRQKRFGNSINMLELNLTNKTRLNTLAWLKKSLVRP